MSSVKRVTLFIALCLSLSALGLFVASASPREKIGHVAFVMPDGSQRIFPLATPANRDDALGIRASVFEVAQKHPEFALNAAIGGYREGGLACARSRSGGMACACGSNGGPWCVRVVVVNGAGPQDGPTAPPVATHVPDNSR